MKNKKRFGILIHIIYWLIIIVTAITLIPENGLIYIGIELSALGFVGVIQWLVMFVFFILISMLKMFGLSIIYLIYTVKSIANRKYYKEKLDKFDFKNDNYYREIISKYSPGVLSYIDNFKLEERDIVATLMFLQLKNKIKILDEIEVIDEDDENLEENEKYILDNIKNNNFKNIDINTFENKVISDCIKDKLLEKSDDVKKKIIRKILIGILLIFVFQNFHITENITTQGNDIVGLIVWIIDVIMFLIMIILPLTIITYIKTYVSKIKSNPYIRSKRGKNINIKLEGLKKYIKEYSLLDKRVYKELAIWEDYIIYSVISGQNEEIVDEIMKKIK